MADKKIPIREYCGPINDLGYENFLLKNGLVDKTWEAFKLAEKQQASGGIFERPEDAGK